ncbi:glycosyltransferase 61 family protein [Oleispirillum naphthae]|uniref:glycosyltransferase 61 family protein n=1 Tax=Oleispirillum naphthae TaxID=2838853 RepID=UPI003082668D
MSTALRLGELYLSQGLHDAAAEAYRRALGELPPQARGNAWWGLGSALARMGARGEAAEAFGRGLAETPRSIALAVEYLDVLRAEKPDAAALAAALEAHSALPESPTLAYALSNALLRTGDAGRAVALRGAALGMGGALAGRRFRIVPFRRSALYLAAADDAAVRAALWDIAARCGAPVRAEGFVPPLGRRESPRALLAEIADGLFLGGETWVADAAGRIHIDLHFDIPQQHMPFYFHVDGADDDVRVLVPEPCATLDGPAIALGGSANYYHWMADFLPRLIAVLKEPQLAGMPILINAARAPFQDWWLHALGVDAARLVAVPYPGAVRCRRLIVPVLPFWERIAMTAPWRAAPGSGRRRLFITRTGGHRRLHGEAELTALLAARGFSAVDPAALPPQEQAALFAEAACIAGPHGAGLVNALFAPPDAPLVEILNPGWRQPFFHNLAAATGRPYASVDGEPCIEEDRLPLFWDIAAPPAAREALCRLLDGACRPAGGGA